MDLPEVILTTLISTSTAETLKAFSPYLPALLGVKTEEKGPLDTWIELQGQKRLAELVAVNEHLKTECKGLQEKITALEKQSPKSGYTQSLQEYVTTPMEDKLEMLRNAILNGLYGDFSLGIREQLFRWVQILQPLDIVVLKYLYDTCRDMAHYNEIYQNKEGLTRDQLWRLNSMGQVGIRDEEHKSLTVEGGLSQFSREHGQPEFVIKQSLDRLRTQGLMHNVMSTFDTKNPYQGCIPTDGAFLFLNFISDPRNQFGG